MTYKWPPLVFEIEHGVAEIILKQEEGGVRFDREAAIQFSKELQNAKQDIEARLVYIFGSWWEAGTVLTPAADRATKRTDWPSITKPRFGKGGKPLRDYAGPPTCQYTSGASYQNISRMVFNPGSHDHLAGRLQKLYGWVPKKFGRNGKPTLDESVLREISEDVLPADVRQTLQDYFVIVKTLGMLSVGKQSWLELQKDDGKIHGSMDTSGAITRRGTHKRPNISTVPAVRTEKDTDGVERIVYGVKGRFGAECRALFTADEGWEQTGVDVASLEFVVLGHFLVPFDGGKFSERVCDPKRDPHAEHMALTGLNRRETKTTGYTVIFGGGGEGIGADLDLSDEEIPELLEYPRLYGMLQWKKRIEGKDYREPDDRAKARMAKGDMCKRKFEAGIEGFFDLKKEVADVGKLRGWVRSLDGGKLYIRKPHATLSTLIQGNGAVICKLWMIVMHRKLREAGLVWGRDYRQTIWAHDELQFTHRPGLGPLIGKLADEAVKEVGKVLKLKGVLRTGEAKTGQTWKDTH